MDIVYVYKEGIDGGESLRLSLWSVARNCHYVDRVFIVCSESCPIEGEYCEEREESLILYRGADKWQDRETHGRASLQAMDGCCWRLTVPFYVEVVRHEDKYNRKHKNILDALMDVVKRIEVGCNDKGVFMYSSDDHWYVQDFDCRFGASEVWIKGRLHTNKDIERVKKNGKKPNNWLRSMVETREVLNRLGYPTFDFSQHANTWFNAELMREELFGRLVQEAQESVWGLEPTCLMMNYWVTRRTFDIGNAFVLRQRKDFKIVGDWSVEKLREEMGKYVGRECVSGSDGVIGNKELYDEVVGMIERFG